MPNSYYTRFFVLLLLLSRYIIRHLANSTFVCLIFVVVAFSLLHIVLFCKRIAIFFVKMEFLLRVINNNKIVRDFSTSLVVFVRFRSVLTFYECLLHLCFVENRISGNLVAVYKCANTKKKHNFFPVCVCRNQLAWCTTTFRHQIKIFQTDGIVSIWSV